MKESEKDTTLEPNKDSKKQAELNSPNVDKKGRPTQRAVTSAKQAFAIGKAAVDYARNEGRIAKGGKIADLYAGEAPFNSRDLARTGQGWRNNYSRQFLASRVDRVKPQLVDPVHKAERLTHSQLPDTYEKASEKSRKFAEVVTKKFRAWPEWKDFIGGLAQDVTLFGNAAPGRINEDWRPKNFGYNKTFLPEGTGQHATKAQYIVYVEDMLLHEFLDLFSDTVSAEKAGYDIEGCRKIANADKIANGNGAQTDPDAMDMSDKARDGALMTDSYQQSGTRTVQLMHVLVHDYTKQVDLWTVSAKDGTLVRNEKDLFSRMDDSSAFFTAQTGNKHYYGSKGLGRSIGNIHIAVERGHCMAHDMTIVAGLPIMQEGSAKPNTTFGRIVFPFIVMKADWKPIEAEFKFKYEDYKVMEDNLIQTADSIAGAFIPPNTETDSGANTKIEAAQRAQREMAVKEGVLGRWFDQINDLIGMMQRGMFSAINLREGKRAWDTKQKKQEKGIRVIIRKVWDLLKKAFGMGSDELKDLAPEDESSLADAEAVSAVVELLDAGLNVEEIALLAQTKSSDNNSNEGAAKDEKTLQFITQNKMNPHIDQREATELEGEITMGKDRIQALMSKEEDPNEKAIAVRTQTIENGEMLDGREMPVAPSDNHPLHRTICGEALNAIMDAVQKVPEKDLLDTARLMINHQSQHIALDQLMPKPEAQKQMALLQQMQQIVDKQEKALMDAAAEIEQQGQQPQPGAPAGQQAPPTEEEDPKRLALDAGELALKGRDADRKDAELQLSTAEFLHKQEMDQKTHESERIKIAADIALREKQIDKPAPSKKE